MFSALVPKGKAKQQQQHRQAHTNQQAPLLNPSSASLSSTPSLSPSPQGYFYQPVASSSFSTSSSSSSSSSSLSPSAPSPPLLSYAPNPAAFTTSTQSPPPILSNPQQQHQQQDQAAPQVRLYAAYHEVYGSSSSSAAFSSPSSSSSSAVYSSPALPLASASFLHDVTHHNHPLYSHLEHQEHVDRQHVRAMNQQKAEEKTAMMVNQQNESESEVRQRVIESKQIDRTIETLMDPVVASPATLSGLSLRSVPPSKSCTDTSSTTTTSSGINDRTLLSDQFVLNEQFPQQKFIRHLVVPTDDLVDMAVRYECSVEAIRRHNRRVVFQHLDNVMNEFIHIPVSNTFRLTPAASATSTEGSAATADDYVIPGCGGLTMSEVARQSAANRQFYSVRSFVQQMHRTASTTAKPASAAACTEAEAKFYCEEHAWNVHLAIQAYKDDLEWEAEQERDKQHRAEQKAKTNKHSYPGLTLAIAQARQARLQQASIASTATLHTQHEEQAARARRRTEAAKRVAHAQQYAADHPNEHNSYYLMHDPQQQYVPSDAMAHPSFAASPVQYSYTPPPIGSAHSIQSATHQPLATPTYFYYQPPQTF